MRARLALESDKPTIRALGKMHLLEIRPDLTWDDERAEATFQRYIDGANPTIFVVERGNEVVGYVNGVINDHAVSDGFFILLDVIYVRPDMRGTRAAAELMIIFNDWTDRLKPNEVLVSASNRSISPKTLRFIQKCGFQTCGQMFQRIPGG